MLLKCVTAEEFLQGDVGAFLPRSTSELAAIRPIVEEIIARVREAGDEALREYAAQFDQVELGPNALQVSEADIDAAYTRVPDRLVSAIQAAAENIRTFHARQFREPWFVETVPGVQVGQVMRPPDSVGIYVPGGRAVYPSTVLMAAVPARVAGVPRVVLITPPQADGLPAPSILVAAREAGVQAVYVSGGAQAIAALAYGTETVQPVEKVVGPGNKYVNVAKQLVSHDVAIDTPAGPSEVLIIAAESADPTLVAIDLVSQLEHDPSNVGVVVTTSRAFVTEVQRAVGDLLPTLNRREIVQQCLDATTLFVVAENLDEACRVSNAVAPEHLEILVPEPRSLLPRIRHAGAIFLGEFSPVPVGDYAAGSNHVLPTGGNARRYSGLGLLDFVKVIDVIDSTRSGLQRLCETVEVLARFEGLDAHARAVTTRFQKKPKI